MGSNSRLLTFFSLGIIVIATSCYPEVRIGNSYCDPKAEQDVWHLPVLKPYELICPDAGLRYWTLTTYGGNKGPILSYSADSVGVHKGKVIVMEKYRGFLMLDTNQNVIFQSPVRDDLEGVSDTTLIVLYSIPELYQTWRKKRKLPWEDELGEAINCGTIE